MRWAVSACLIVAATCSVSADPPTTQPVGPASQPAAKGPGPQAIARAHVRRLGDRYISRIDHTRKLIFISAIDKKHFADTVSLLADYTDAQRKGLLTRTVPWYVTIILPTPKDYRRLAPGAKVMGFYHPPSRTLVSIDRGRVLLHEFTHALHHADYAPAGQRHPRWVSEGLATLFESAKIGPRGLTVAPDRRLLRLQRDVRTDSLPSLKWLLTANARDFMRNSQAAYGHARYVMLYLHSRGKLSAWYRRYKQTFAADATGQAAMEAVLGKRLAEIEVDWKAWVRSLKLSGERGRDPSGRLGIQMKNARGGVEIISMIARGAAAQAGRLRVGDTITHVNGRPVSNVEEFSVAMTATAEMQTVPLGILRNGRAITMEHPMAVAD